MLDVKAIRENPELFDAGWAKRGLDPKANDIIAADARRRDVITDLQAKQSRRNEASKEVGKAKASGDETRAQELIAEVAELKSALQAGEDAERDANAALDGLLAGLPNIPFDDVPMGADEADNQEVRQHGQKPELPFEPKEHFELGEALGQMDFETAAKISGSRFVVLTGDLARLERAIASFMLDLHTLEFGYTEVVPPLLVSDDSMFGTAQLPKFAEDQFYTEDGRWLVPTAEVPLTNLARERIFTEAELPMRVTAYTPCFRKEAGAAGRDTRGMIRQHQFSKVELVSVTTPEKAVDEHERMTSCAEEVLKRLDLHYRVVVLCTGDMGFSARKTYDLEVWLPGQNMFREISSCSVCGDFQARRMNARYRPDGEKATQFVHTLNGSGLAVGRTMVAILENYQQADGSIAIPDALQPYMAGRKTIELVT